MQIDLPLQHNPGILGNVSVIIEKYMFNLGLQPTTIFLVYYNFQCSVRTQRTAEMKIVPVDVQNFLWPSLLLESLSAFSLLLSCALCSGIKPSAFTHVHTVITCTADGRSAAKVFQRACTAFIKTRTDVCSVAIRTAKRNVSKTVTTTIRTGARYVVVLTRKVVAIISTGIHLVVYNAVTHIPAHIRSCALTDRTPIHAIAKDVATITASPNVRARDIPPILMGAKLVADRSTVSTNVTCKVVISWMTKVVSNVVSACPAYEMKGAIALTFSANSATGTTHPNAKPVVV